MNSAVMPISHSARPWC